MRVHRLLVPALLIVSALLLPIQTAAQDATPPPGEATPAPRAMLQPCSAEPRNIDEVLAVWFEPSGTPAATPALAAPITDFEALPEGERADEATVAAITETTLNWISCLEFSGQSTRGFTFMTDHFLSLFGPDLTDPAQDTAEEVRTLLEGQLAGTPVPNEVVSPLVGPRRARMLEDGRVGAIWGLGGNRYFFIYEQVDGRWLIDDAIDVIEPVGTPVAGTPAAGTPAP